MGNMGNMGNIGLVLTSKLYPSNYKRITFIPLYLYTCISHTTEERMDTIFKIYPQNQKMGID